MMENVKLELDEGLYARFRGLCEKQGLDPEDVIRQYLDWIVSQPEEAQLWLRTALEDEGRQAELLRGMPKIPVDGADDARWDAIWDFVTAWNGPVCLEQAGRRVVTMTVEYFQNWYGACQPGYGVSPASGLDKQEETIK